MGRWTARAVLILFRYFLFSCFTLPPVFFLPYFEQWRSNCFQNISIKFLSQSIPPQPWLLISKLYDMRKTRQKEMGGTPVLGTAVCWRTTWGGVLLDVSAAGGAKYRLKAFLEEIVWHAGQEGGSYYGTRRGRAPLMGKCQSSFQNRLPSHICKDAPRVFNSSSPTLATLREWDWDFE